MRSGLKFAYAFVRVTNNQGRECMHLHALSVKFWLAASPSQRCGRCGFDALATSLSSLRGFGSIIEKIREFSDRRTPRASRTNLVSASAKLSPRSTSCPLILCRTYVRVPYPYTLSFSVRVFTFFFAPFSPFFPTSFGSRDDRIT